MGRVWLASFGGKHGFRKQVAIKTVLPELASDATFRSMLLDEARLCSRLEHANVAQILDVGEHGDVPYIVFEWVEGASLEQIRRAAEDRGETVALGPLLRVMADVSSGLHAAHELADSAGKLLNVVHRDVTPNNIVVSRKGFAKLIDFGVAKARNRMTGETRSGIVKGTPQYMAPEQARGDKVDWRADVWAVGAVLYRALQGAPPFKDRFDLEDFVRKKKELAPLRSAIPSDVRDIVTQAMQRDPAERFVSADELRFALERSMSMNDTRRSIRGSLPARAGQAGAGELGATHRRGRHGPGAHVDRPGDWLERRGRRGQGAVAPEPRAPGTDGCQRAPACPEDAATRDPAGAEGCARAGRPCRSLCAGSPRVGAPLDVSL